MSELMLWLKSRLGVLGVFAILDKNARSAEEAGPVLGCTILPSKCDPLGRPVFELGISSILHKVLRLPQLINKYIASTLQQLLVEGLEDVVEQLERNPEV